MEVVEATDAHAVALAPTMRAEDMAEVRASGGYGPLAALRASLRDSAYSRALLVNGEVAALWGVSPLPSNPSVGVVWLLTGDCIERRKRLLLTEGRNQLGAMLEHFPVLINAVDERYARAKQWLERLGAQFGESVPFGVEGRPFRYFWITKELLHV